MAKGIEQLPRIDRPQQQVATGTLDVSAQLYPQQLRHDAAQSCAKRCDDGPKVHVSGDTHKPLQTTKKRGTLRPNAAPHNTAGERIRTADVQLGKLTFYH